MGARIELSKEQSDRAIEYSGREQCVVVHQVGDRDAWWISFGFAIENCGKS